VHRERGIGRVVGLRTGHWVMLDKAEDFNAEVARWLAGPAPTIAR
jgi:pimeloyl-ACP methyl ester carboxylesterase